MNNRNLSTKVTLWVNRFLALTVAVLVFALPALLRWYSGYRQLSQDEQTALMIAFCCCALIIEWALWNVDRLLAAILAGRVFIRGNVRRIRRIQWCCGGVSLVCVSASVAYLPLVFLVVIMAFLCLAVGVIAQVMDSAVTIREENDLTI